MCPPWYIESIQGMLALVGIEGLSGQALGIVMASLLITVVFTFVFLFIDPVQNTKQKPERKHDGRSQPPPPRGSSAIMPGRANSSKVAPGLKRRVQGPAP